MKQSIFKKELSAHGANGTITGEVIATMNYKNITVTGTHAVTHDDYTKLLPVHKVEAKINGEVWKATTEIPTEELVFETSKQYITECLRHMQHLSNVVKQPSFVDKMNELFE
jgi:hypothetical protein